VVHLRVIDYGMGFGHPAAANESEDRIMPYTKEATQRKRRTNALPVLGAASLSFSLATGAPAAVGSVNPDPATSALVAEQVMDEEQISDVSLATFHVLDNEGGSTRRLRARPTVVSQGACGADLYLPQNPPAVSGPIYQAPPSPRPRPTRPASKYRRSWLARADRSNT
jgi:hypothetical protein